MKLNASIVFRLEKAIEIEMYEVLKQENMEAYEQLVEILTELFTRGPYNRDDIIDLVDEVDNMVHAHVFRGQ